MDVYESIPRWMIVFSDHFKTEEMCIKAVRIKPLSLAYVPDHFKTEEMCNLAVVRSPYTLKRSV